MDPKALAALAMEGGQFAAMDGLPSEVAEWIKKVIEAMAGGGAEPPSAREDEPVDPKAPAMREEDMPAQYRTAVRTVQRSATMMLGDTIRLRLHTARTVDGLTLDADTETELAKCKTIEQFEREFALVKRIAGKGGEQQRARSGVVADEAKPEGVAVAADVLRKEGFDESFISMYTGIYGSNPKGAEDMLNTARRARVSHPLPWKTAQNGAAK